MTTSVICETGGEIQRSVIWLHGLGADGNDFAPIVPELNLPNGIRFIFPHAPTRAVTINNGFVMRAWYDIIGIDLDSRVDEAGIHESEALINELIANEIAAGIASENIVLAGFSQGGAMALHCGLRYQGQLAGILGLSCYLPLRHTLPEASACASGQSPIFIAHGQYDPVVHIKLGEMSRDYLIEHGYQPSWHVYPMEHAVCPEEISAVSQWLRDTYKLSA